MEKVPDLLEEFNRLSSKAWQPSVQHECDQGDHCVHVGSLSQPKKKKKRAKMIRRNVFFFFSLTHICQCLAVSYRTARYPLTHISMNHLKGVASIFPPMIITISSVSLMSGSQPRFPPGELSNMKPKSGGGKKKPSRQSDDTSSQMLGTQRPSGG